MSFIGELSFTLGQHLADHQLTLTTAESCTGGGIAQAITDIPGSSQWFSHGFISYSNIAKQQLLGVEYDLIERHGAVSQAVAEAMAIGALSVATADLSVAVTGIAGPGGGTPEKPVGTVWISWGSTTSTVESQRFLFSGDRNSVRNQSVIESLKGLICLLEKNTV